MTSSAVEPAGRPLRPSSGVGRALRRAARCVAPVVGVAPIVCVALAAAVAACAAPLPVHYADEVPAGSGRWVEIAGEPAWVQAPPPREGHLRFVVSDRSNLRSIVAAGRRPSADGVASARVGAALAGAVAPEAAARAAAAAPQALVLVHRACRDELLTRDPVPGNTLCTAWALWELPIETVVSALPEPDRTAARAALAAAR